MTTVKQFLETKEIPVWSTHPKATVIEALAMMAEHNIGALPILEKDVLVGIFSERDYARKVELEGRSAQKTHLEDLMTRKVISVSPDHNMEDCMRVMSERHIRHLPVVEEDRLIGMITIRDVVKVLLRQKDGLIRDLEGYIRNGGYV